MVFRFQNNVDKSTQLSKKLSYLLRHGAVKEGLNIEPDGYILVTELLTKALNGWTIYDIEYVVANNAKKRFTLKSVNGVLKIKANQGHSISDVDQLSLKVVKNPTFDIVHGTYYKHWRRIKTEGLSRMNRNHIHFGKGLNFECGLRNNAEIYIYINFQAADTDNLEFYESENGVILCAGNSDGLIESKYFKKVVTRNGEILL